MQEVAVPVGLLFIVALLIAGFYNQGKYAQTSSIIKEKQLCVSSETNGLKFNKCYDLVERK